MAVAHREARLKARLSTANPTHACSEAEIAISTGHSLRDVAAILDAHYLSRDSQLAESALRKRGKHKTRDKTSK